MQRKHTTAIKENNSACKCLIYLLNHNFIFEYNYKHANLKTHDLKLLAEVAKTVKCYHKNYGQNLS